MDNQKLNRSRCRFLDVGSCPFPLLRASAMASHGPEASPPGHRIPPSTPPRGRSSLSTPRTRMKRRPSTWWSRGLLAYFLERFCSIAYGVYVGASAHGHPEPRWREGLRLLHPSCNVSWGCFWSPQRARVIWVGAATSTN